MVLLFLHGPAACGKLTVAREIVALTGFRLFHNHLVVDLVGALFEFGSPPFVRMREQLWLAAFREAARADLSLVFTFHPEASVTHAFPRRARELVEAEGGRVHFVELSCPEQVVEQRIEAPSRAAFGKLRSLVDYRRLRAEGAFEYPPLPTPLLCVDTSRLEAAEAARRIAAALSPSNSR